MTDFSSDPTVDLTTETDNISFNSPYTLNTVEGLIDTAPGSTDSTYTAGDSVKGNGRTVVKIAVDGTANGTAALAKLSGIAAVDFNMQTTYTLTVPASEWTDVSAVDVTGLAGSVDVKDFNQTSGPISLSIKTTKTAHLSATGMVDGLNYTADVGQARGAGAVAVFGTSGVQINAGTGANVNLDLSNPGGKITIGNVTGNVGLSGELSLLVADEAVGNNAADKTGLVKIGNVAVAAATKADVSVAVVNNAATKAYDGSGKLPVAEGTAGGVSVGNVTLSVGLSGSADVKIVDHGATVGNLSVGNIELQAATSAFAAASLTNEAVTKVGNVTAGNVTVGNVKEAAGDGYFTVFNAALAGSKANLDPNGNATAGHIAIGNVSMNGVQNTFAATNAAEAYAVKGSAVANGISTGNISLAAAGASANAEVDELAYAVGTGAAAAGNIIVGNVSMVGNTYAALNVINDAAELGKGNADAGSVTVGNILLVTGGSGVAAVYDSAMAAGGVAKVGNVTVGNISADIGASGSAVINVEIQDIGDNAADTSGLVKVGNVNVAGAAYAKLTVDLINNAATKVYGGSGPVSAVAAMGKAGGVSVGNVALAAGVSGSAHVNILDHGVTAGNLSVGNVNVTAAAGAHVNIIAANGNAGPSATPGNPIGSNAADVRVGNVSVGNVSMKAAPSASVVAHMGNYVDILSGNATVGNVTIGNVSLTGAHGVAALTINNDVFVGRYNGVGVPATGAGNVAAGNMTVGNISLHGSAYFVGYNQVDAYGVGSATVGNINVGNIADDVTTGEVGSTYIIDLARAASNGNATAGDVTIGNVSLTGAGNAFADASMYVQAFAVGAGGNAKDGNISAGNITLSHVAGAATGGTERFELSNNVIASNGNATAGNVTVGNISINPGGASGVGQTGVLDKILVYNTVQARNGHISTAGNIAIGNVTGPVGLSGELSFLADDEIVGKNAANKTGLVKAGNVAVDGAAGAQLAVDLYNLASTKLYNKITHSIITDAAAGAGMGTAGGISVGNVALAAGASGSAQLNVKEYAGAVGTVTLGSVSLDAPKIALEVLNDADKGNAGNINVGNITLTGNDSAKAVSATSAAHANFIKNIAASGSAGSMTVGNVSVNAGAGQTDALTIADEALTKAGGITLGNVNLAAGSKGNVDLKVFDSAAHVGNINAGNMTVNIGAKADASISVANHASASKGAVSAGNVTVGNINMKAAASATITAHIKNHAHALTGNATIGNVTVGNVSLQGVATVKVFDDITTGKYNGKNKPGSGSGDATAGTITVGNVSVQGSAGLAVHDTVDAYGKGNATVGNIYLGNIAAAATDATGGVFAIDLARAAQSGDATAGNLAAGNISLAAKGSGSAYATLYLQAFAVGTGTGNAKDGNIGVGNVTMTHVTNGKSGGADLFELSNNVIADHGNATSGKVTVGNISINPGGTSQIAAEDKVILYNTVQALNGHIATAGQITVGNVSGHIGLSGELSFLADNEDVGNNAANKTGLVKIGNVAVDGATGAQASVDIYNVASTKLYKSTHSILTAAAAGVGAGTAGDVTVGNVTLAAGASGSAQLNVREFGGSVGTVTIGNVSLNAPSIALEVLNDADKGNAGNINVGNITLTGNDSAKAVTVLSAANPNFIENIAKSGSAGSITVGNVGLSAGAGQTDALNIVDDALVTAGPVTLGNVNITVHNTNSATHVAKADLDIHTTGGSGGNIKVGNITVAASGVSTQAKLGAANMAASFSANSEKGSVTVGNIKVSGGVVGTAGHTLDNLGNLTSWLHLSSGTGKVTVGNIDYSGYVGGGATDTIINVSQWSGADSIIGAQGGSTIDDNAGQNIINVSDTTKADNLYFSTTQNNVTDANVSAGTTVQSSVDEIIGFHNGDTIAFTNGELLGGSGNGTIVQGSTETWAQFLTAAATDIHGGDDAYAAIVNGDTYVALNHNDKVVEIVEVTGLQKFTDADHVLHWAS